MKDLAGLPLAILIMAGIRSINSIQSFYIPSGDGRFSVQLMFVFNFFYSIFKGRKFINKSMGRNTLSGQHLFVQGMVMNGRSPEVHAGLYYTKDGKVFSRQNQSDQVETALINCG
jgi:cytochrome c oxidase subunit 1